MLIETGVLGLFTALVLQSPWARLFGVLIVAGLAAFAAHVAGMIRSPRPRQPGVAAVDFAIAHAAAAGLSLAVACALGLYLLFATPSDVTLRAAMAYGVVGLLGFLGQMVVAMETRLLPLFAWYWAYAGTGFKGPVPPPHAMRNPTLQGIVLSGWAFGVPALAVGFFFNAVPLVDAGAWALSPASRCRRSIPPAFWLAPSRRSRPCPPPDFRHRWPVPFEICAFRVSTAVAVWRDHGGLDDGRRQ